MSFVDEDSSVRYLVDIKIKYEYVDLGLPSGLKWATCNVGATSPEQAGLYFAWGETIGYTADDVTSGIRSFTQEEYNVGPAASIDTDLTLEQDAAHVNMEGGNWRMPTNIEFQELIDNCNTMWTDDYNGTGIKGRTFTSKLNGKSMFFPAAGSAFYSSMDNAGIEGKYWSSNIGCYNLGFSYSNLNTPNVNFYASNYEGISVRAVCE